MLVLQSFKKSSGKLKQNNENAVYSASDNKHDRKNLIILREIGVPGDENIFSLRRD